MYQYLVFLTILFSGYIYTVLQYSKQQPNICISSSVKVYANNSNNSSGNTINNYKVKPKEMVIQDNVIPLQDLGTLEVNRICQVVCL